MLPGFPHEVHGGDEGFQVRFSRLHCCCCCRQPRCPDICSLRPPGQDCSMHDDWIIQRKTSPKEGGLGGQSLPELGRGSLPEENQLSRQLSQLENWRAVAARVLQDGVDSEDADGPGSRATDTQGSMAPWYMEVQLPWLRLLEPGDRSKATSFS